MGFGEVGPAWMGYPASGDMKTPWLYRVARMIGRVILGFYFRKVEIAGGHHVPGQGPVLFAANHPQSITDALILGVSLGRPLHFIAHSGLFKSPVRAWFLNRAGVIPVLRSSEIDGALGENLEMFRSCRLALEKGHAIAIFPEGISFDERRVQRMKTGTARIALESEAQNNFDLGVQIVPLGINFESQKWFRSRVLVTVGEAISVSGYVQDYDRDPVGAVQRMTADLHRAVSKLVVHVEDSELERLVRDIEEVYQSEILTDPDLVVPGDSSFKQKQHVSREIARSVDYYQKTNPVLVWRLATLLKEYRRKRARLQLSDRYLSDAGGPTLKGEVLRVVFLSILGFPIAAYGAVWNVVPYKLTGLLAKRAAKDATKFHWFQLTYGTIIYLCFYPPLFYLALKVLGTSGTILFGASLVVTGLFSRWYGRAFSRRRSGLRFAYLAATNGYFVQELKKLRRQIITTMDGAREEYLKARSRSQDLGSPGR